jgi:large subunit ribosomal protein L7/L12
MADLKTIADQLVNLTVKEVNELADILKEDYGIEPAAAPVAAAPAAEGEGAAAQEEEQTEFNVVLKDHGPKKLEVVKVVKKVTESGLKEAKEIVDNLPNTLKEAVSKEDAESFKQQLEDAGAEVELQ